MPDVSAALEGVQHRRREGDADKRIVLDCAVDGPPPSTAADFPAAAMGPLLDAGIIAASSHFAAALWLNGEGLTRFTSLGFVRTKQRLQPCHLYGLSNADA